MQPIHVQTTEPTLAIQLNEDGEWSDWIAENWFKGLYYQIAWSPGDWMIREPSGAVSIVSDAEFHRRYIRVYPQP